jgi:hypothetical protein
LITRNTIRFVPTVSGVSKGTQSNIGNGWQFQSGFTSSFFGINGFTYTISRDIPDPNPGPGPSAVPLPAGAWLLLAGLGALSLNGRRRRT